MSEKKIHGALAEFGGPAELLAAAEKMRSEGYKQYDCHSPYAIHGMDDAMGEKRSRLSWVVAGAALTGFVLALLLQWWTSAVDYPLILSGKVYFSYQAFFPITFGLTVLFSVIATVGGLIVMIRQSFHHPVFYSDRFRKVSDDGFFVSVLAADDKFDSEETSQFLASIGGRHVELLEGS